MALDAEQLYEAARRIHAWRADPKVPVGCPACGKLGLAIVDRGVVCFELLGLRPQRDAQHPARTRSAIAGLIA